MASKLTADMLESEMNKTDRAKTAQETDRRCPACNGVLAFDPASQKLKCPYCDSVFTFEELAERVGAHDADSQEKKTAGSREKTSDKKQPARGSSAPKEAAAPAIRFRPRPSRTMAERPLDAEDDSPNCSWGVKKKVVVCKTCGASTIYDAVQTASRCPYCESNQIIVEEDDQLIAPTGIAPFKLTKEQAIENFKKWVKDLWFAPGNLKNMATVETLEGFYLPYWTYDVNTATKYSMDYGKKSGENLRWHSTSGRHEQFYDDYLVPACAKQNRGMMNEIAPFNTNDYQDYRPEYLAGFVAERYSVSVKEGWKTADGEIRRDIREDIKSKVLEQFDADMTRRERFDIQMGDVGYKYLLLLVWHAAFRYGGSTYQFMVNGQNGKVSGKRPYSGWKIFFFVMMCLFVLMCLIII